MANSDNHFVAQAVHDLGSALWLGGAGMGLAGVNKAGRGLATGLGRVRGAGSGWAPFRPAQWGGIAATLLAGLRLTQVGGRRIALQKGFGSVGALKAGLAVAGAGATAYAAYAGSRIGKLAEEAERSGTPLEVKDATLPSAGTPPEIAKWQRRQR